jgi:hypothetical protein
MAAMLGVTLGSPHKRQLPATQRRLRQPASFPSGIPLVTHNIVDIAESRIISPLCGGELALLRTPNCYPQHCGHCGNPHHFRADGSESPCYGGGLMRFRNPNCYPRHCVVESRTISHPPVPNPHGMVGRVGPPIVTHNTTLRNGQQRYPGCGIPQCPFRNVVLWVTIGGPTLPTMPWAFGTGGWVQGQLHYLSYWIYRAKKLYKK